MGAGKSVLSTGLLKKEKTKEAPTLAVSFRTPQANKARKGSMKLQSKSLMKKPEKDE